MLTIPEVRLSASNAAILSSSFVLLPVCVRCCDKDSTSALRKVEAIISALRTHPAGTGDGIEVVSFEDAVSPRLSRVDVIKKGKESSFSVTVSIRAKFLTTANFWSRIAFVDARYQELTVFALEYQDMKGVDVTLDEARLEHQKEEPDRFRVYRK